MSEDNYWERFRKYHDISCEEMEAPKNSDEYWKKLQQGE